jgi:hypothetical protein
MEKQLTCADRINDQFSRHIEQFNVLLSFINDDIDLEDLTEEQQTFLDDEGVDDPEDFDPWQYLNEYGLSLELDADTRGANIAEQFCELVNEYDYDEREAVEYSHQAAVKWCLSYGGPADYLIVQYGHYPNRFWDIEAIAYCFQDWFDGAVKYLYGDDFETVRQILEYFIEFDSFFLS